jgi:hypothetical protein
MGFVTVDRYLPAVLIVDDDARVRFELNHVRIEPDTPELLEADVAVRLREEQIEDVRVELEVADERRDRRLERDGLRDELGQLLVREPMHGNALVPVEARQLGDGQRLRLDGDRRLEVESLLELGRRLGLGELEELERKDPPDGLDENRFGAHGAPDRRPVGLIRGRRIVPRQDGARPDHLGEEAEPALRIDLEGGRELEPLAALGALRHVPHAKARQALILPGRAVIEREVEPHVLEAAGVTHRAQVARGLVHVHHGLELFVLRVVPEAAEVLVERVALDRQHLLERAVDQVPEVVGVGEQEDPEPEPRSRCACSDTALRIVLDSAIALSFHGRGPLPFDGRPAVGHRRLVRRVMATVDGGRGGRLGRGCENVVARGWAHPRRWPDGSPGRPSTLYRLRAG